MTILQAVSAISLLLPSMLASGAPEEEQRAFFDKEVGPLLVSRCLECHGGDQKGGLDLRQRATALEGGKSGAALVPGDASASHLVERISEGEMPPKEPLDSEAIATLRKWIDNGAYFPESPLDPYAYTTDRRAGYDWWSLQPIADIEPPAIEASIAWPEFAAAWSANPIDRFIAAKLDAEGMLPSPPADARTLIRRVTYDLTGLPPAPQAIDAFLAANAVETGDPNTVGDNAYGALVDQLLASPRYGEQWGRHWLDVARFGESTGFEVNHLIDTMWPYRDYVIDSLNEDKPFDRFVKEQLAGDALAPGDPNVEVGLTFLVAGPTDIVGNQDPAQAAQIRANTIDEMIRATSEAFFGLTVGCARCHDHKFDPIATRDYYRLYATFAGVHHGDRAIATAEEREAREAKLRPLREKREAILAERNTLMDSIMARAEANAETLESQWVREPTTRSGTEEAFPAVEARHVRLVALGRDNDPNSRTGFKLDEFEVFSATAPERNVALAENGGTATGRSNQPGDFADAYSPDLTIDGKYGARWVAASPELMISFAKPERIDRVVFSSDRPAALDPNSGETPFLAEYRIEASVDGEHWFEVASTRDRKPSNPQHRRKRLYDATVTEAERGQLAEIDGRIRAVDGEIAAVPGFPTYRVGTYDLPEGPFHVFYGGDPQRPGDIVTAASPSTTAKVSDTYELDAEATEQARRVALAEWIVSRDNPLTARVLANRLWHYHFGTGIVSTPSDFGYMGTQPTHPELLDWLAREIMTPTWGIRAGDGPWQWKRMHRLILLSRTYRQASTFREGAARADGGSRLLWRFPPRRLTGEELRDTILAITGTLDTKMGGPGFRLYSYLRDNVSTYVPLEQHGPETYRRAIYHQNARASRIDLVTDFDAPDCAMAAPRRVSTTTPLQALTMMNHTFTIDMANALAERVDGDIAKAYELAYGREPEPEELKAARTLANKHGIDAFCRALLNTNELIYID